MRNFSAHAETVSTGDGLALQVDPAKGDYSISTKEPGWTIGGSIAHALTDLHPTQATDAVGPYKLIEFKWEDGGKRSGSIRLYDDKPLALFSVKYEDAVTGCPTPFPISESAAMGKPTTQPMICATHNGSGDDATYYVFAFARDPKSKVATARTLDPQSLGIHGSAIAYDFLNGGAIQIDSQHPLTGTLNNGGDFAHRVIVPIQASGMALIGDVGLFVTRGRQRIASSSDDAHALHAAVVFGKGDQDVTLPAYAPSKPQLSAKGGTVGAMEWDESIKVARVKVMPDSAAVASE